MAISTENWVIWITSYLSGVYSLFTVLNTYLVTYLKICIKYTGIPVWRYLFWRHIYDRYFRYRATLKLYFWSCVVHCAFLQAMRPPSAVGNILRDPKHGLSIDQQSLFTLSTTTTTTNLAIWWMWLTFTYFRLFGPGRRVPKRYSGGCCRCCCCCCYQFSKIPKAFLTH